MLLIEEGVGHGSFSLDSLFTTGTYVFRAYTNWMQNFSEPNYYEQTLEVIDPETDEYRPNTISEKNLDAQFLPEGGRAVAGLEAVYGVIVKDPSGRVSRIWKGVSQMKRGRKSPGLRSIPLELAALGCFWEVAKLLRPV